jgi:hypothetical protein
VVRHISSDAAGAEVLRRTVTQRIARTSADFARELGRFAAASDRLARSSVSGTTFQNESAGAGANRPESGAHMFARTARASDRGTVPNASATAASADAKASPVVDSKTAGSGELAVSLAPNPFNPAGGIVVAKAVRDVPGPAAAAPAQVDAPAAPVDILRKKLDDMGIGSSGLQFTETRTVVGYPGGSYVNHMITVDFGGGVTENYDVAGTLRNPWLTAFEIGRLRNGQS